MVFSSLAPIAACVLGLSGVAGGAAPVSPLPGSLLPGSMLQLSTHETSGRTAAASLTCRPTGGSHPEREAACTALGGLAAGPFGGFAFGRSAGARRRAAARGAAAAGRQDDRRDEDRQADKESPGPHGVGFVEKRTKRARTVPRPWVENRPTSTPAFCIVALKFPIVGPRNEPPFKIAVRVLPLRFSSFR